MHFVRLAWDLLGPARRRAPGELARWFLEHLDEHDPLACTAPCCNTPITFEVPA